MNQGTRDSFREVSVVVVVALKTEFEALQEVFVLHEPVPYETLPVHFFDLSWQGRDSQGVVVCIEQIGQMPAQDVTARLLRQFRPTVACIVGISGMLSNDLRLGDVVVSQEVDMYMERSKVTEGTGLDALSLGGRTRVPEPDYVNAARNFQQIQKESYSNWQKTCLHHAKNDLGSSLQRLVKAKLVSQAPKCMVGPTICGPLVVASERFKEKLKGRDRNMLAVDMESGGFLEAVDGIPRAERPSALVVRGISDGAAPSKALTDGIRDGAIRGWAMKNACLFLKAFLKEDHLGADERPALSASDAQEELHAAALKRSVVDAFPRDPSSWTDSLDRAETLFALLQAEQAERSQRPIDKLLGWLENHQDGARRNVIGPAGSGKSTFMSAAYLEQHARFASGRSKIYPILIDLHKYARPDAHWDPDAGQTQVESRLMRLLYLVKILQQDMGDGRLLFLLDGYDSFFPGAERLKELVCRDIRKHDHLIVAVRSDPNVSIDPTVQTALAIGLVRLDGQQIAQALRACAPSISQADVDACVGIVTHHGLNEIDLFSLILLFGRIRQRPKLMPTLSSAYEAYCRSRLALASKSDEFSAACKATFDAMYACQRDPDWTPAQIELCFLQSHEHIREFLVAQHIMDSIGARNNANANRSGPLQRVYTFRLNRFCKEILQSNDTLETSLLAYAKEAVRRKNFEQLTHICYLLGRVQKRHTIKPAQEVLRSAIALLSDATAKRAPLLERTIYLSLAYLKDDYASSKYIQNLVVSHRERERNNVFHLEYYGDIEFHNNYELMDEDDLSDFPRTFSILLRRIQRSQSYPLYDVEVFTIFSLAQQRHAQGKLTEDKRLKLIELADDLLRNGRVKDRTLRNFVAMVFKHLKTPDFTICSIIEELYNLKRVRRSGYVRSGIGECESVADHSFGAALLASMLFATNSAAKFDEVKLHRMLWVHDLAEAITGDLLPEQKDESAREIERDVYEYLGLLGTYRGMPSTKWMCELWDEFRRGVTDEAKLAADADVLENLFQLHVYVKSGHEIRDFHSWKSSLLERLSTKQGQQAGQLVLRHFQADK